MCIKTAGLILCKSRAVLLLLILRYSLHQQLLQHHLNRAQIRLRLRQPSAAMAERTAHKCALIMKQSSFCVIARIPKWMVMAMVFRVNGSLGGDEGL